MPHVKGIGFTIVWHAGYAKKSLSSFNNNEEGMSHALWERLVGKARFEPRTLGYREEHFYHCATWICIVFLLPRKFMPWK